MNQKHKLKENLSFEQYANSQENKDKQRTTEKEQEYSVESKTKEKKLFSKVG